MSESVRVLVLDTAGIGPAVEGLAAAVAERIGNDAPVDVTVNASPSAIDLASELTRRDLSDTDVLVLGIGSGLEPPIDRTAFAAAMTEAVDLAKRSGCRVLLFNGSTVVPSGDRARSVAIAALNLAAVELSMTTGISVIDVDRAIAELGGDAHVADALTYSPVACAAIRDELVRVLADYGFFDDRPLLLQVGQQGEA